MELNRYRCMREGVAVGIVLLFFGVSITPFTAGMVEHQRLTSSLSSGEMTQDIHAVNPIRPTTPANGPVPPMKHSLSQKNPEKTQQSQWWNRDRFDYFYAYNAYDPNGMNYGEVWFGPDGVVHLIGDGCGISFISGEALDSFGEYYAYGVAYGGGLYYINLSTGAATLIASCMAANGMALDVTTGTYYVCGGSPDGLYTINIGTGQTAFIGSFGISNIMISIFCDPQGNMYGYDVLFGGDSHLYSIDKNTGAATVVGDMGHNFCYAQDGFIYGDGTCYIAAYDIGTYTSYLATVDLDTAAVTEVAPFYPTGIKIDGFAGNWWWTPPPSDDDVAVKKILAPVAGTGTIITPKVTVVNLATNSEFNVPVNMTITKNKYTDYMNEDFAGSTFPPAGWSNIGGTGDNWVKSVDNYAGGTSPEAVLWYYNNYGGTGALQSPYVDTSSESTLTLTFRSYIYWWGGDSLCKVYATDDGGATWNDVSPWPNPIIGNQGPELYSINLSSYISTQTGVRFVYSGQYYWMYFWAVDDVRMYNMEQINEYNQTVYTDILENQMFNITFPDWTPADLGVSENVDKEYIVNASTQLVGDDQPWNDYKQKTFNLHFDYFHDVALTGINSPQNGLAQTQPVQVVLADHGQNNENVTVNVHIGKITYNTLLQEDFNSGVPPTGWGTDAPQNWFSSPTNYAGGTAPEAELSWTPSQEGEFHLYTYTMDTTGWTNALLKFKEYVNDYNGDYTLKIQSKWGGGDWHDVYIRAGGPYGPTETPITFGTADGLGASDLVISFTFSGNLYNINYWYIDDVWFGQMSTANEYNQTVNVNFTAGQTMNVDLPDWTPADIPQFATDIDYLVDASASMNTSDEHPVDNELSALITLRYEHDVGVLEILQPILQRDYPNWFTYGGDNANAIGLPGGGTFEGAIRMTPAELAPFNGDPIVAIQYCHGMLSGSGEPTTNGYMKIYGPGTATSPGALLVSEPFSTPAGNDWFEYWFQYPITVDATQDLWFSVECDNTPAGAYPLGVDDGPPVDGKSDWASFDGGATWIELQTYGLDYNWNHMVGFGYPPPPPPPGYYHLQATVKNFGVTFTESNIPVEARITHLDNNTVIYDEAGTVPGPLIPGVTTVVTFPNFYLANLTAWEGSYKIEVWTLLPGDDHPENDKKSITIPNPIMDVLPPITNHSLEGTMGLNGWYVSDVILTLTAFDPYPPLKDGLKPPSGVNHTYYKLHEADPWTEYLSPVMIVTDGCYDLCYYSIDKAWNSEIPKGPYPFNIDITPPTITLNALSENALKTKWLLNATVADATSGVAIVEFYVDDILVGNITAPGPYVWHYQGNGKTAQAIVYDYAGNSAVSNLVQSYDLMVAQLVVLPQLRPSINSARGCSLNTS
jgi:hypothetical protein